MPVRSVVCIKEEARVDQTLQASIFLNGVLPLMENLVDYDQEAADTIAGKNLVLQFDVKHGPAAYLEMKNSAIRHGVGIHPRPDLWLTFPTPERFNRLMAGDKITPGIRKGFTRLAFLTERFPNLGKRLNYYLQGDGQRVEGLESKRFLVRLGIRIMLGGMVAVANHDPSLAQIADATPVGTLMVNVLPDGPTGTFTKSADNTFSTTFDQPVEHPNAVMELASLDAAKRLIDGDLSAVVAIGTGDVRIRGFIPLIEKVNIFLGRFASLMRGGSSA